ncbi:hypothetical protein [Pseudoalteromonas sp. SSM20]|uniref:hypothetical protein n=1 Tax=Pseudoalteromonas sp. SSM20 TaxID=3139394 RepID=UPI003BACC21C
MQKRLTNVLIVFSLFGIHANSFALDANLKGIVDLRAYHVASDDSESYLAGNYGKYRFNDGSGLALGQLGAHLDLEFNSTWSATVVANAFANKGNSAIGITEGYLNYKSLPTSSGWRIKSKLGVFYPTISFENVATAWSTPYSLTSSSLNNWVGEELRNTGINLSLEKLGKFSNSKHDFSADVSLFKNNDPAGAMLAWHGWTIGSRQTLLHEKLIVQDFPARNAKLKFQAAESDPFLELDDRFGLHISANWKYDNKLKLNFGFYDNFAKEGVVENGQYTWTTEFIHSALKYRFAKEWEVIAQYMQGNTYMTSPYKEKVVDNDFDNAFVMLRHFWSNHHIAARFEHFNVDDLDDLWGDNNNEQGNAFSFAYRYKLSKQSFLLTEFNYIDSHRPSRWYLSQAIDKKETQYQIGYRYYFNM